MTRIRPRFLARWLARLGGYFWLPCPICHEDFAGYEWPVRESLMIDWGRGRGVCSKVECIAESRRRNAEYMAANPVPTRYGISTTNPVSGATPNE